MKDLVVLTRPAHRNTTLAARLTADGIKVLALPALRLENALSGTQQVPGPEGFDLLVFVSGHAVQLYCDNLQRLRPDMTWPEGVRAATVGYASAEPLYRTDLVPEELVFHPDPGVKGQDSEGLWQVLQPVLPKIKRVLIVRGQAGREWLGAQFEGSGVQVTRLSLYRREPEIWDTDQPRIQGLINELKAGRSPIFLLTSSESVDALHANVQGLGMMPEWAQCRFLVIHERISAHLQTILHASGVNAKHPIMICAPTDDAIYQAIRSSVSHSGRL